MLNVDAHQLGKGQDTLARQLIQKYYKDPTNPDNLPGGALARLVAQGYK
jgi:hypothetical protein